MRFRLFPATLLLSAFVVLTALPAAAQDHGEGLTALQRRAVERTIRDYLLANPEILIEMSHALEEKQKVKAQTEAEGRLSANRTALLAAEHDYVLNPDGNVPVVEFFDYNCGYCKRSLPAVLDLQKNDPRVRFVFKEFPILGAGSVVATRAAIAAKAQGRYLDLHNAMMAHRGSLDRETVLAIAGNAGLDLERLQKDMADPRVDAEIAANMRLAEQLNIRGTPTFVIGDTLVPGAIDRATMAKLVEEAAESCRIC